MISEPYVGTGLQRHNQNACMGGTGTSKHVWPADNKEPLSITLNTLCDCSAGVTSFHLSSETPDLSQYIGNGGLWSSNSVGDGACAVPEVPS